MLVISSPVLPSPRDRPRTKVPSIYFNEAEIPSIFGSAEKNIFAEFFIFKKLLIFFMKSIILFLDKRYLLDRTKDHIGELIYDQFPYPN